MSADFLYLASGSPRRRELLAQIGVRFQVLATQVDESTRPGEAPEAYVLRLAQTKALAGAAQLGGQRPGGAVTQPGAAHAPGAELAWAPVLGADTVVVQDGRILTKPEDAADGERMLAELSGRMHVVLTGIALATSADSEARVPADIDTRLSRSEVTFRVIAAAEARAYWLTGEPRDKAGGYAIQGLGAVFVAALRGSFSGVMGLPLYETAALLDAAGVPRWRAGSRPIG